MRQWLDDHGAPPDGEHIVPKGTHYDRLGRPPTLHGGSNIRIDFTRLRSDPDYPLRGRDDTFVLITSPLRHRADSVASDIGKIPFDRTRFDRRLDFKSSVGEILAIAA
ncbi:hypothetical protein LHFGNBLO_005370 [Mesorhizobium sp. AR10]|nr:hypothetical protein LHFGNBLO_005370 [Mesorhizobium sp. AR10]